MIFNERCNQIGSAYRKFLTYAVMAFVLFCGPCLSSSGPADEVTEELVAIMAQEYKRPQAEMRALLETVYYETQGASFPQAEDVLAVIVVESRFNPRAIHPRGPSVGLMQVNASAHKLKTAHLLDYKRNVGVGTRVLREYYDQMGSVSKTLVAYNSGITKAKRICKQVAECNNVYTRKVSAARKEIRKIMFEAKIQRLQSLPFQPQGLDS